MKHSGRILKRSPPPRKARFLAALRIAGVTMDRWARKHGTTQGYVSNLLTGRRQHAALERKIESFIEDHLSLTAEE